MGTNGGWTDCSARCVAAPLTPLRLDHYMPQTMKGHARNLMTERVIALEQGTPVTDMLQLFAKHHLSGAPVIDEGHRIVGFVSETDLLGVLLRKEYEGMTAADVMSTPPICVDEFMPTDEVMTLLRENRIHHLPVVREGRLVGIITPQDILRYLVERVLPLPPASA
ncbi:CBS domain-containing protein [Sorangium sp. So ce1014]|uniref:CBS domain-containing protein n=1 Tax=Sorangium sp. So ce1014 TaxID=3133326 RepID=UPI003F631467